MDKAEVARRQLGTALHLFLNGQDPVSVHCLATGGGEIAEWLAQQAGAAPFTTHILENFPDLDIAQIRRAQRKHWNAFKHATTHNGKDRDDASVLSEFEESTNEHLLFVGWYDYGIAGLPLPIEAQVFEAWYFAKYPEKVSPDADISVVQRLFPALAEQSAEMQRASLTEVIRMARKHDDVMADPRTDFRPLVLTWPWLRS